MGLVHEAGGTRPQFAQTELKAAIDSGRQFGQVLGEAFALAFKPLSLLIGGIQWVIGSATKLRAAVSSTAPSGPPGSPIYDAMGYFTGMTEAAAPALPQPAMRSGTTTANNTTNVAPATVVVTAKDANAKRGGGRSGLAAEAAAGGRRAIPDV